MQIAIIFISNLAFSVSRVYSTRVISKEMVKEAVLVGLVVKTLWIVSTSLGINSFLNENVLGVVAYIVGGAIGDYIGMRLWIKK